MSDTGRLNPTPKQTWLLLALAGSIGVVLIWTEQNQRWFWAQGAVVAILAVLALVGWSWLPSPPNHLGPLSEAETYNLAIRRLLMCLAIGFFFIILNATRQDRWECGTVAKALAYPTLVAGASLMSGVLLGFLFGFRPVAPSQTPSDNSSP